MKTKTKENIFQSVMFSILLGLSAFTYGIPMIVFVVLALRNYYKAKETFVEVEDLITDYEWEETFKALHSDNQLEEQHDAMMLNMAINEPYIGQENW